MILQGNGRVPVDRITLHCAALKRGQFDGFTPHQVFTTVDAWHKERGFKHGFAYHAYMMPDGRLFPGRPQSMIGAHVLGHNPGSLGWLLIESHPIDHIGRFSDWFTTRQDASLRLHLSMMRGVGITKIDGHNDYANRLCPGFRVESWLTSTE